MTTSRDMLTVELEGRGTLKLRPSDYIATGGEGSVYRAQGTVVKIYTDDKKMSRDRMDEKIRRLAALQHPLIFGPQGLVRDSSGRPIGFYGAYASGEPMARIFTTAFRQREGFMDAHAARTADRMRDVFRYAHDNGAILADPNELNWVVKFEKRRDPEPRVFDVDSWAIGPWKATVVMPSIRDWHHATFDELSDWFAWGVVTFQIFTGIHPYRGTLDGYAPGEFERRMKNNASVFTSGIRLNRAVRDFNCIPRQLLDWYEATFEHGLRAMPPSPKDVGAPAPSYAARMYQAVASAAGVLVFEKLLDLSGNPAIRVFPSGAALTASGAVYDLLTRRKIGLLESRRGEIVRVIGGWLFADEDNGNFQYRFVDERTLEVQELTFALRGRQLFRYENRLFLVTDSELVELALMNVGRPLLTIGKRTPILAPNATQWLDGIGIEKAFGATFLVLPFGEAACVTLRAKELDGLTPVAAKAGNRFVSVIGLDATGVYHKIELTFAQDYATYSVWNGKTDIPELNMAILPQGVCATVVRDGELVIFVPVNGNVNRITGQQIATDMALANWNDAVVYIQNGAVWKLSMR